MPIYEYRCDSCGAQKEHIQKVGAALLTICPACGQSGYRKLLSAAAFQLKGSGWYATDFKGSGASGPAKTSDTSTASASGESCGGGCACHPGS